MNNNIVEQEVQSILSKIPELLRESDYFREFVDIVKNNDVFSFKEMYYALNLNKDSNSSSDYYNEKLMDLNSLLENDFTHGTGLLLSLIDGYKELITGNDLSDVQDFYRQYYKDDNDSSVSNTVIKEYIWGLGLQLASIYGHEEIVELYTNHISSNYNLARIELDKFNSLSHLKCEHLLFHKYETNHRVEEKLLNEVNYFVKELNKTHLKQNEEVSNFLFKKSFQALSSHIMMKYVLTLDLTQTVFENTIKNLVENSTVERWKQITDEKHYIEIIQNIYTKPEYVKLLNDAVEANPKFFQSFLEKTYRTDIYGDIFEDLLTVFVNLNDFRALNGLEPNVEILDRMLSIVNETAINSRLSLNSLKTYNKLNRSDRSELSIFDSQIESISSGYAPYYKSRLERRVEIIFNAIDRYDYKLDTNSKRIMVELYTNLKASDAITQINPKLKVLYELYLNDDKVRSKLKFKKTGEVNNTDISLKFKETLIRLKNKTLFKSKLKLKPV